MSWQPEPAQVLVEITLLTLICNCARKIGLMHFWKYAYDSFCPVAPGGFCTGAGLSSGFELLPPQFTLSQLQRLYETVLETPLDKRNFRKKILGMDFLVPLDEVEKDVAHRAARLYRFDRKKYSRLQKRGFNFEI